MPTTFQDREQAFEAQFAHEQEFQYLIHARRDKLFARWAAARLELSSDEADALVKTVVSIPDGPGHDQALLQHISGILSARARQSHENLNAVLEDCTRTATAQLTAVPPSQSELL